MVGLDFSKHFPQVFEYALKLMSKLPEPERQKASAVVTDLLKPQTCWEKFVAPGQKTTAESTSIQEDDVDMEENMISVPQGPLATVKESFNKSTGALLELLLDVMCGKYYSDLQELASSSHLGGLFKAVQAVEHAQTGSKSPELLKQLQLVTSQFDGHSKSVAPSTQAPPPSLLSTLARNGDAAEADADREQHWKTVQSERRRFVSFGVPNTWSRDGLLACFRSSGKVFGFSGVLNTAHRLFCASADLVYEEGSEPWATPCPPPDAQWKDAIGFIGSTASGPADFAMLFDGRMWDMRRLHEP